MTILQRRLDRLYCLSPEWTCSLTSALAVDAHIVGTAKPDVVDIKIHNLLGSCPCIVKQTQQGIIPSPSRFLDIDMAKDVKNLFLFQVSQYGPCVTFERYGQNRLALGDKTRIGDGQIAEEGVDGCQSDVAGPGHVFSNPAEVCEEPSDKFGGKIIHGEIRAGLPALSNGELQKKFHGVPIGEHRVRTQSPLGHEMLFKEMTYRQSDVKTL
jgi:hypothetical protein